ncbi:MAG: DUF4065 domain-containing protein [Bacteroidales bacterium]|nr:DUF4065 domain-containing protein [Bacteroidales bacterium]
MNNCIGLYTEQEKAIIDMKPSSQGVGNYLLDLAQKEKKEVTILPLMKLVYLVHGFSLAIYNKSALNPHYDKVEAWKYGPVIPSLYHELKRFGSDNIKKYRSQVIIEIKDSFKLKKASLDDKEITEITNFVWESFKDYTPTQLVELTHASGSPWHDVYKPDENNIIDDAITKRYFKALIHVANKEY